MNTMIPSLQNSEKMPLAAFDGPALHAWLDHASQAELDLLDFGVIGMDANLIAKRYNKPESTMAGLSPAQVLDHPFFEVVAPCMNNYLVAQQFTDALATGADVDATLDYVLTLRMKPTQVTLRLLASAQYDHSYVVVNRKG